MPAGHDRFSVFDLGDLAPAERQVWLALVRTGPAAAETLALELGQDILRIQDLLDALDRKGRIRPSGDGQWRVVMGRIKPHTTLPPGVWPAMLGTDRLYSEQDIETLQTAIPMLQFARAKLSEFVDHGPSHALRVKTFATQLSYIVDVTTAERHLLRAAALFHDIGNVVDRGAAQRDQPADRRAALRRRKTAFHPARGRDHSVALSLAPSRI